MNKINKELLNKMCIIDNKYYELSDVEKMDFDGFSFSAHRIPYTSLFRYYPNTKKYIKEEKKYRNYSFESLENNTIFLQDAKNFDDCFDCAVDLDYNKFLNNRAHKYCEYFNITINENDDINKLIYYLSCKLYECKTTETALLNVIELDDEISKLHIEVFINKVFINLIEKQDWNIAILEAINDEYNDFYQSLSNFKICCFSTSPYLNRMWSSAYANNNKGFCIEYEIDLNNKEHLDIYNNIFPVIYSPKRNDFSLLSLNVDKSPTKEELWQIYFNGLLRKSHYWADQQEWRLILPVGLIKENPMTFLRIKKVYLGCKMSREDRLKIIKYCKLKSIEYVGIIREPNSFNLVECAFDCNICNTNSGLTNK